MPSLKDRAVDIAYRIKDYFTGPVRKIEAGYKDLSRTADRSADSIERSNRRSSGSFDRLAGSLTKIRGLIAGLGAATAGGAAFKSFVDRADAVGKTAQKLGVTADELTALGYAAERSNIQFDSMSTALQRLIRRSAEAAKGTGEAKDALRALGIDAQSFVKLSLEQKMVALADAFKAIDDQGERVALAFKLFDAEGVDMVRVLQDGGAAMQALTNEARDLGKTLDDETTRAAAAFNDSLTKIEATLDGLGNRVGATALGGVNQLTEALGISADHAANLRTQLEILERQQAGDFRFLFGITDSATNLADTIGLIDLEQSIEDIRKELTELEDAKRAQAQADKVAAEAAKEHAEELKEQARVYDLLNDRAERSLEARKDQFKAETEELRKAKAEQLKIQQDFQNLVDEIARPEIEDVGLGDIFGAINRANAELERGQTDNAVKTARDGADLLKRLKDEGTESAAVLKFLAEQLQNVANKAGDQNVSKESEDVRVAGGVLKTYEAQLAVMQGTAKVAGNAAGIAYFEAMQAAMSRLTLEPPKVNAPSAPDIRRSGNSFSDGSDYRSPSLEREIRSLLNRKGRK